MHTNAIENVVYLSALGDGWGYLNEFTKFQSMPKDIKIPDVIRISDDTQMAIAVIDGLLPKDPGSHAELLNISDRFIVWNNDPDNNRAPGETCKKALNLLEMNRSQDNPFAGTVTHSKGCGANMRAGWLGLLNRPIEDIKALAREQARITHGHPTALEASALTALGVWAIAHHEVAQGQLVEFLIENAELGDNLDALNRAYNTSNETILDLNNDPCLYVGEGWVAEEALALAARLYDVYYDPKQGLYRGVRTGGDSDSIACIAGSFFGAGLARNWREFFDQPIRFEPRYEQELKSVVIRLKAWNSTPDW